MGGEDDHRHDTAHERILGSHLKKAARAQRKPSERVRLVTQEITQNTPARHCLPSQHCVALELRQLVDEQDPIEEN